MKAAAKYKMGFTEMQLYFQLNVGTYSDFLWFMLYNKRQPNYYINLNSADV